MLKYWSLRYLSEMELLFDTKALWVERHEEIISLAANGWKGRWMIFLMHAARLRLIKKLWCSPASRPETARPITNRMWLNKGTRTTKIYIALTLQGKRNTVKLTFISCVAAVDAAYVISLPPALHPAPQLQGWATLVGLWYRSDAKWIPD